MEKRSGRLIVFEGIDGTGKSTQIQFLHHSLRQRNIPSITTREPTDGQYGQRIRALYRNRQTVSREEELSLFLADRNDHVTTLIGPALDSGQVVLCDRYFLSTAAYQGALGLDPQAIIEANTRFAPVPDLALLFELGVAEAIRRITQKRGEQPNDFEQFAYLQKVDTVFRQMRLPYIRRLDASRAPDRIHCEVRSLVDELLGLR